MKQKPRTKVIESKDTGVIGRGWIQPTLYVDTKDPQKWREQWMREVQECRVMALKHLRKFALACFASDRWLSEFFEDDLKELCDTILDFGRIRDKKSQLLRLSDDEIRELFRQAVVKENI